MDLLYILFAPIVVALLGMLTGKGLVTFKEMVIQEVIIVVVLLIAFFAAAMSSTTDVEIWNGVIAEKGPYERSCSESYSCNCRTEYDYEGNSSYVCDTCWRYWDVTTWYADTSNGESAYRAGSCYNDIPNPPERYLEIVVGEPTSIEHTYTNYLKAADETVLTKDVPVENFTIPEYPEVYDWYRVQRFIPVDLNVDFSEFDDRLDEINGELGAAKQVNIIVLVVNDSDQNYIEALRSEWLGGKKNDFIVLVGADQYPKITWASVLSWSDSEDAKVHTKNRIMALEEFDGDAILDIIEEEVSTRFVRKEMADFEYLKWRIEPSAGAKLFIAIFGVLASLGLTAVMRQEEL